MKNILSTVALLATSLVAFGMTVAAPQAHADVKPPDACIDVKPECTQPPLSCVDPKPDCTPLCVDAVSKPECGPKPPTFAHPHRHGGIRTSR